MTDYSEEDKNLRALFDLVDQDEETFEKLIDEQSETND